MFKTIGCIITLWIFAVASITAQEEWIIEFQDDQIARQFVQEPDVCSFEKIIPNKTFFKLSFCNEWNKSKLAETQGIIGFMPNTKLEYRVDPNDPRYTDQWPLPLIQADLAWNEVEHGFTADGKEIVIAIVDSRIDIEHEDFINNIWFNQGEIPDDGIDNDGNSYIDDFAGLNTNNNTDNHQFGSHGTKVAGIIGAEADNGLGIAGINWNIKLMILSGVDDVANILEAYEYIIDQRKRYNETNGEEGAFVVATNFSGGVPMVFPTQFPSWCSLYEDMGREGILSVASADNEDYDVDILGDMPTTCNSDYLITVTSTTRNDTKTSNAAFGQEHVDLGAPGADTFSTLPEGGYGNFNGTSAAAPHVAGAIGLLYTAECEALTSLIESAPSDAALMIKSSILENVVPLIDLNQRTVSNGRLDIFNAKIGLAETCGTNTSTSNELTFEILGNPIGDRFLDIEYEFVQFVEHQVNVYSFDGKLVYSQIFFPSLFGTPRFSINISNLTQGMYAIQITDGKRNVAKKFIKREIR